MDRCRGLEDRARQLRDRAGQAAVGGISALVGAGLMSAPASAGRGTVGFSSVQGPIVSGTGSASVTQLDGGGGTVSTSGGRNISANMGVVGNRLTVSGGAQQFTAKAYSTPTGSGTTLQLTMTATTTGGNAANGSMKMYTSGKTYSASSPSIASGFTAKFTNSTSFTSPRVTFYAQHSTTSVNIQNYAAAVGGGAPAYGTFGGKQILAKTTATGTGALTSPTAQQTFNTAGNPVTAVGIKLHVASGTAAGSAKINNANTVTALTGGTTVTNTNTNSGLSITGANTLTAVAKSETFGYGTAYAYALYP